MKEKKQIKTKIGVGSIVKAKVRNMEEKTREGRSRRTRKEATCCIHAMVGKKKFVVQFEDGQKREMSASSLSYVCEKEEVGEEVDKTIYDLPNRGQGDLLNINGDPVCEVDGTFEKGIYLSIFYCLCFVEEI